MKITHTQKRRFRKLLLTASVVGLSLHIFAQSPGIEWQAAFGGTASDYLTSSQQTSDGGYIFGGYSNSGINGVKTEDKIGLYDYWIVKTDILGNISWQNTIGGTQNDYLNNIEQTADGGYIIGGTSFSGIGFDKSADKMGAQDYWIVKVNSIGVVEWEKTIGGNAYDYLHIIHQTPDGGYIAGGYSDSGISGNKSEASQGFIDYWVVKLDGAGNVEWDNTIGGSGTDNLFDIGLTADGGYIVGGNSTSGISGDKTEASSLSDYWILKLDATGTLVWQNTIGGSSDDYLASIIQSDEGGYIVGGKSNSGISGDKTEAVIGGYDYWVLKLDAVGNITWQNTLGGTSAEELNTILQASDGEYLIAGTSSSAISGDKTEASFGLDDYWLVKLDASGVISQDNTIGGNKSDNLIDVQVTADNGYILGGYSSTDINGDKTVAGFGGIDFWTVKLLSENCPVPFGTYADNITTTKAKIHWNPIPGVGSFQVWFRPVGAPGFTKKTTTTNAKTLSGLTPNTTYEYKVRTKCLDGNFGEFSELLTFTTLPLKEENMNERSFIFIYPNPVSDVLYIDIEKQIDNGTIQIRDIAGALILEQQINSSTNVVSLTQLGAGVYFVIITTENEKFTQQLIKQ